MVHRNAMSDYPRRSYRGYSRYPRYNRHYSKAAMYQSKQGKYGRGSTWASNAPSLARTALKTAKWVAGLVNTEYKVFDFVTDLTAVSITNNALPVSQGRTSPIPISQVTLGDDMNQRQGRSVKLKSVQLRLTPKMNTGLDHFTIRIALVCYMGETTSSLFDPNQVWIQPSQADRWVRAFRSVMFHNSNIYKIMWDKVVTMDQDFKSELQLDKYFKTDQHIKFRDTYDQGHLFLVIMYDNLSTAGTFDLNISTRIRYIDN